MHAMKTWHLSCVQQQDASEHCGELVRCSEHVDAKMSRFGRKKASGRARAEDPQELDKNAIIACTIVHGARQTLVEEALYISLASRIRYGKARAPVDFRGVPRTME